MAKKRAGDTLEDVLRRASSAQEMVKRPVEACANTAADESEIAVLAYRLWLERGCPEGSPEEDWYLAEGELRRLSPSTALQDTRPLEPAGTTPAVAHREKTAA